MGNIFMWFILQMLMAAACPASGQEQRQPASYWRQELTPPLSGSTRVITLTTSDPVKAEKSIKRAALKAGAADFKRSAKGPYVKIFFILTEAGADACEPKLRRAGRLSSYQSRDTMAPETLEEFRRKAAVIKAELENNAGLLKEMPIARGFLEDLLNDYSSYLGRLEAVKGMVRVQVVLTPAGGSGGRQ